MTLLDEDIGDLLRHLDHPLPPLRATDVMRRVASRRWIVAARAATVLLALGLGGVGFAAPSSPLSTFVVKVTSWMRGTLAAPATRAPAAPDPSVQVMTAPDPKALSGVAVSAGRKMIIEFRATQERGTARVSLDDVPDVSVRTLAGGGAFTSTDGALHIDNQGSIASFAIVIPRAAPHVEIRVGGRRIFLTTAGRVSLPITAQSDSIYDLALTHPKSIQP